jgi:hypothetical protein
MQEQREERQESAMAAGAGTMAGVPLVRQSALLRVV